MTLQQFFGRCYKAGYKLRVKHFALQNFFGPNVLSMEDVIENETLQSIVFFDTFGGNGKSIDKDTDSSRPAGSRCSFRSSAGSC